jgi:nitrite reductase (NADH) small subunit
VLHCPWHGWQFELDSGRCPDDPRMRVAVYQARIAHGRVLVLV